MKMMVPMKTTDSGYFSIMGIFKPSPPTISVHLQNSNPPHHHRRRYRRIGFVHTTIIAVATAPPDGYLEIKNKGISEVKMVLVSLHLQCAAVVAAASFTGCCRCTSSWPLLPLHLQWATVADEDDWKVGRRNGEHFLILFLFLI